MLDSLRLMLPVMALLATPWPGAGRGDWRDDPGAGRWSAASTPPGCCCASPAWSTARTIPSSISDFRKAVPMRKPVIAIFSGRCFCWAWP